MFDPQLIRKDFPVLAREVYGKPLVYLDSAATTQKPQSVIDAITHYYEHDNANIHRGVHTLSMRATQSYENARARIATYLGAARPEEVKEALEMSLNNNFAGARERLDTLQITYGLAGEDVLRQMHRSVRDLEVPDTIKVQMIEKLAEADFRLSEGANARIQIEAVIANFAVLGRHIPEQ